MHMQTQSVQALIRPAPQNANHDFVARTMSSREIADLTGKRHDNVKADIRAMLADLKEDVLSFQGIYLDSMNRQQTEYLLDREHTDCLLTGYSAAMRMAVIKRWRELEAQVAQPRELSRMELIQLAMAAEQEKLLITAERDQAVATTAEIGSRREATAMATASAAVRRANQLEAELGRNTRHATVTAVESALGIHLGKQGFRPLKKYCKDNGITPEKVPCPRYGKVVAWPAAAWDHVYSINLSVAFGGSA